MDVTSSSIHRWTKTNKHKRLNKMINQEVIQIVQLNLEDMYKLFYSLCEDEPLVNMIRNGSKEGLNNTEISELWNKNNDRKPKSGFIYINNKPIPKEKVRVEIEARTKLMVQWFVNNLGTKAITKVRSEGTPEIGTKGIDFNQIGVKT